MPLILAIDRDARQSAALAALVRERVTAELCQAGVADDAIERLAGRVPDLILVSPLLSPRDDDRIAAHLRALGTRAAHVQTLRIPVLGTSRPGDGPRGVLARLRRERAAAPDGCDPDVFAREIWEYLERAADGRGAVEPPGECPVPNRPVTLPCPDTPPALPSRDQSPPDSAALPPVMASTAPVMESTRPPETAPEPASALEVDTSDFVLPDMALLTEALSLDDWQADPVLAEFQDAILELELADITDSPLLPDEPGASPLRIPGAEVAATQPPVSRAMATAAAPPPASGGGFESPGMPERATAPSQVAPRQDGSWPPSGGIPPAARATPDTAGPVAVAAEVAADAAAEKPMQDEWGLFDPEQCGFAALVARLEQVSRDDRR